MSKVKIGIIGAGFNGQIGFIENFFKNKDCQIFGLAEARENLRKKVINKYKIKNAYVSHKDLIKDIIKYDGIAVITKRDMIGPISSKLLKFIDFFNILGGVPVFSRPIENFNLEIVSARCLFSVLSILFKKSKTSCFSCCKSVIEISYYKYKKIKEKYSIICIKFDCIEIF